MYFALMENSNLRGMLIDIRAFPLKPLTFININFYMLIKIEID